MAPPMPQQARSPNELGGALKQALVAGKPAVVDPKTDIEGIAPPPWY